MKKVRAIQYLSLMVLLLLWGYKQWYGPANRKKVRWVVYGASISGGGGVILWLLPPILLERHIISANTLGLLTLPFPITLAIAVFPHQLFDIEVLINRTLVYGLLTGSLAIVYFSRTLREEVDLETLQSRLAAVIQETIHPESLSIWLREPD